MKIYRTVTGIYAERDSRLRKLSNVTMDAILRQDRPVEWLNERFDLSPAHDAELPKVLAPLEQQEVWAAGVTYFRSRTARMEESKAAGGGDFYDRVYNAERPELFFKSNLHRAVGHEQHIRIRRDSKWNVPEPELTLAISASGKIVGYTIGNDVSSRDIEGENPLYLPQAKVYSGSCALGPAVLMSAEPLPADTPITLAIRRAGAIVFTGGATLAQLRRQPEELVEYLFRDNAFPFGCFLMTGTGIIPPDDFTLHSGDEVTIEIPPIGSLVNMVA